MDFGLFVKVGDRTSCPRLGPLRYITWSHPPVMTTGFFSHGSFLFFLLRFCPTHPQRWRVQSRPVRVYHRHLHPPKNLRSFLTSKLRPVRKSLSTATRKTSKPHHQHRHQTSLEMYLTVASKHGFKSQLDGVSSSTHGSYHALIAFVIELTIPALGEFSTLLVYPPLAIN